MPSKLSIGTAAASLAVLLATPAWADQKKGSPACGEGKIAVRGECVAACPTAGVFADPSACECRPGFGKIIHGDGAGECARRACAPGALVEEKSCDCADGLMKKAMGKGKMKCVAPKATAKARANAKQ